MKRLFVYLLVPIIAILFISCERVPVDPSKDKVDYIAYWSFDDSTAKDQSVNGYDGVFVNSPEIVDGYKGKCIRLVGKNWYCPTDGDISTIGSHVLLPPIDFTKYKEFTISLWVCQEDYSHYGGEPYIWWGHFNRGWIGILNHPDAPDPDLSTWFTMGSKDYDNSYKIPFDYNFINKWVHYVIAYNNGIVTSYINSKLVNITHQKIMKVEEFGAIGRHWWNYEEERTSARFTGRIDEVKIFKKVLCDADVQTLYLQ